MKICEICGVQEELPNEEASEYSRILHVCEECQSHRRVNHFEEYE